MILNRSVSLVFLSLAITASTADEDPCRLWLAPSHLSTEGNVKYGLFAGVEYAENETLPLSELALPLVDFMEADRGTSLNQRILNYMESQLWTADFCGAQWEGNFSSTIFVAGIGVLSNYHSGIYNVDWLQASALLKERNDWTRPGQPHASRGAVTPYSNVTLRATQRIPIGMELFANFGDVWDAETDQKNGMFQDKISRWDYEKADQVLEHILKFMDTYKDQLTPELEDEILDFMLDQILGGAAGKNAKVIRSLIPAHPRKLQAVQQAGGTFAYRNSDLIKKPKWLDKNGVCVDKMRPGKSTIADAGRGAFATRRIAEDEIIVPVPMIPLANEELLDMYDLVPGDNQKKKKKAEGFMYDYDKPRGKQLAYNYCFGHRESSLVLFPVGPLVTLINHSDEPNAKLVWSEHISIMNDEYLLDTSVEDVARIDHPNLVMNLVALREIAKDEEIFIDYGSDWANMWKEYKQGLTDTTWPLKAEDVRVEYQSKPYPTEAEDPNPYPTGVATVCFIDSDEVEDGTIRRNQETGTEILQWYGPTRWEDYSGSQFYPCVVLERSPKLDDGNLYNYTVLATQNEIETYEIKMVPHRAITLIDQAYTSDIHTPQAFRHWIDIDDDLFPQAWRDLRP